MGCNVWGCCGLSLPARMAVAELSRCIGSSRRFLRFAIPSVIVSVILSQGDVVQPLAADLGAVSRRMRCSPGFWQSLIASRVTVPRVAALAVIPGAGQELVSLVGADFAKRVAWPSGGG